MEYGQRFKGLCRRLGLQAIRPRHAFYRYISENITAYINQGEHEAGFEDFDYAKLSDEEAETARDDLVRTKGFFILPSELFHNLKLRAKDDENLRNFGDYI